MAKIIMGYRDDILSVANLELPWESFNECNILVTGATGLIGGCIIDVLMLHKAHKFHVYALGRNEKHAKLKFMDYANNPNFHFIKHDVTQPLSKGYRFDYIIHAASGADPSSFSLSPVEVMKSNLYGVVNLMEYGINHGMRRFLFLSSGEIYGEGDGRVFKEDYSGYVDSTSPRSCYPSSKRAAETLCVSYAQEYNADVVIARPCHVYGPGFTENDNRVYAQFIRNVQKGEDIVMKSAGNQFRSWCYVVDCVSALFYILFKGENGQAYNIADSTSNITIRELAEMIARISHSKVVVDIPTETERHGFNVVNKSIFSTSKLESLGWKICGSMETKIRNVIKMCKLTKK